MFGFRKSGPLVMEMSTYRYGGHSMSDPGISYRSKEEVKDVRENRDCILKQKARLMEYGVVTKEEIQSIDKEIKKKVDVAVQFALDAPMPQLQELYTDVYTAPVKVRGRTAFESSQ
jgi:pyruvate dehydrogenase E1 component alpha subunit